MRKDQNGIAHVLLILLIVVILAVVGFVGWRVFSKKPTSSNQTSQSSSQSASSASTNVDWQFDGSKWQPSDTPPTCPNPLVFNNSPADVSKATAVLYPGQTRGGNYKPHGGLRFDGLNNSDVKVSAVMDAQLVEGSRYIEQGEVQYMLRFTNACGISYRFDHLLTLAPTFQEQADKLPAAKQDDSRTTPFDKPISVKAGDVVATAVGFKNSSPKNTAFDFGVYDLRQPNEASKNASFVSKHQNELSQAGFAVCWFDMLPSKDAAIVKSLPAADQASGKTSDYCK